MMFDALTRRRVLHGSAAFAVAGAFWTRPAFAKDTMVGLQASARGDVVRVRLAGNRVFLGGRAVTVVRGGCWRGEQGRVRISWIFFASWVA